MVGVSSTILGSVSGLRKDGGSVGGIEVERLGRMTSITGDVEFE